MGRQVAIRAWSAAAHRDAAGKAAYALDIKGTDFRRRHKPAAKAANALASGLALAVNPESGPAEQPRGMGFDVCDPGDLSRWMSPRYADECRAFGEQLARRGSRERVAARWRKILEAVCAAEDAILQTAGA